jgi:hypothetical protein
MREANERRKCLQHPASHRLQRRIRGLRYNWVSRALNLRYEGVKLIAENSVGKSQLDLKQHSASNSLWLLRGFEQAAQTIAKKGLRHGKVNYLVIDLRYVKFERTTDYQFPIVLHIVRPERLLDRPWISTQVPFEYMHCAWSDFERIWPSRPRCELCKYYTPTCTYLLVSH